MKKETLEKLGIRMDDIDAAILMDEGFNGREYGLDTDQCNRVRALHDFLQEYREDLSKPGNEKISCSKDAVALTRECMMGLDHEELWCAFLNKANVPVAMARMSSGGLDCTLIDPRMILARALREKATGLIIYHNHPSGDPTPGSEDIKATEKLRNAAKVLDINLLDHIVISDTRWYSFAEERQFRF